MNEVSIPSYVGVGLAAASSLIQKMELSSVTTARQKAEESLMRLMDENSGPISMDPDLSIRAFQALSNAEVQLIEAKRKFLETFSRLGGAAHLAATQPENNTLNPEAVSSTADPLASAQNSAFGQMLN